MLWWLKTSGPIDSEINFIWPYIINIIQNLFIINISDIKCYLTNLDEKKACSFGTYID